MFRQILALIAFPAGLDNPVSEGPDLAVIEAVRALSLPGGPGSHQPGGRVYLMHVRERSRGFFGAAAPSGGPLPQGLTATARALAHEGIEVVTHFCDGRLTEEVDRVVREEQIDVVVVGRPARGWGDHGLRVVRLADAPVLVMPEGTTLRRGTAVVGMDFSHNAVAAWAAARGFLTTVTAVAILDPEGEQANEKVLRAQVLETWRAAVATLKASGTVAENANADLRIVASTRPADTLLLLAKGADLLAVGSRGLTPLAAVLLGSTAEKLGAKFPNPLLVFRDPGTRRGLFESFLGAS